MLQPECKFQFIFQFNVQESPFLVSARKGRKEADIGEALTD